MLESIIPLLQILYWPALVVAILIGAFTALLAIYYGFSAMRRGHRAPAPESKFVAALGWIGFAAILLAIGPVVSFMASMPIEGLTDFIRDDIGQPVGLSILGGTRIVGGDDQDYIRFWVECVVLLVLGGRGVCFAVMMWPSSRPKSGGLLRIVTSLRGPYDKTL